MQRIAQSARVAGRHAFPAAVSEIRARADVRHNERQTAFHRFERGKAHGLVIQRAAHIDVRGTHQRFGVRAVARADDVFVKAPLADALAHGVKKLSVTRDETSKRIVRALLELRKRVQQEEKPLFRRIARHGEKDEAILRQRELRPDDVSPRRQGLRRNAVEDHADPLFFDAVFAQKVRPLRTNRDTRGIVRCDTPVDGTPEEALAHRKMAREHDARLPPPEAREHGDHIFPRVLRVDNVDTVFRAQPGNALRRGERVRGAQVEPEHAAAESLCLFRELSAVHVGKEAAVSLRGIRPHQVFDVLFRTRLSGVADEIENVQFFNRRASRSGCRRRGSASFPHRSWTPAARRARS